MKEEEDVQSLERKDNRNSNPTKDKNLTKSLRRLKTMQLGGKRMLERIFITTGTIVRKIERKIPGSTQDRY
nr:hypothetical protein BaRGS_010457 [Batillaria attramentaria]